MKSKDKWVLSFLVLVFLCSSLSVLRANEIDQPVLSTGLQTQSGRTLTPVSLPTVSAGALTRESVMDSAVRLSPGPYSAQEYVTLSKNYKYDFEGFGSGVCTHSVPVLIERSQDFTDTSVNRIIQVYDPVLTIDSTAVSLEKSTSHVYSWDEGRVQYFWHGNLMAQQEVTLSAGNVRIFGLNQRHYRMLQTYDTTLKCPQW